MKKGKKKTRYKFYTWDDRLLRRGNHGRAWPELWRGGEWVEGPSSALDAVVGMGPDPYSCGEFAFEITLEEALHYAEEHEIDLFAGADERSELFKCVCGIGILALFWLIGITVAVTCHLLNQT